jgi:hypothetical protein
MEAVYRLQFNTYRNVLAKDLLDPVSFDLDGLVALMTGASRGIGHEPRAREGARAPSFTAAPSPRASALPVARLPLARGDDQQSHRCREIAARARRSGSLRPRPAATLPPAPQTSHDVDALAAAQRDRLRTPSVALSGGPGLDLDPGDRGRTRCADRVLLSRFVKAAGRRSLGSPAAGGGERCRRSRAYRFPGDRST